MPYSKEERAARKLNKANAIDAAQKAIEEKNLVEFRKQVAIAQQNGMSKGDGEFWILSRLSEFPKMERVGGIDKVARLIHKSLFDFGYTSLTVEYTKEVIEELIKTPTMDFGTEGFSVIHGFVKSQLKDAELI